MTAFAQDLVLVLDTQVLVLVLVLESEVLVLVLGTQVLVLVLGEKSLLTTLLSSPKTPSDFSTFKPASESEISNILFNCPNKQCDSDPIPTWLLKECSALLVPTITKTNIVNLSLSSGNFHHTLKESVISPLLKKPTLDKDELSNYTAQFPTSLLLSYIKNNRTCR